MTSSLRACLCLLCCLPLLALAAEPSLVSASGRAVFWRGEVVVASLTAPMAAPATVRVSLRRAAAAVPVYAGTVTPKDGVGRLHLCLPTSRLGDGTYTLQADGVGAPLTLTFTVRDTTVASPGMIIDESSGAVPNMGLARLTGQLNLMTDGRFNVTGTASSESPAQRTAHFDSLMRQQALFWNQDASRPFSFYPPYLLDSTDGEYTRRLVLGNTVHMQYPGYAGSLYDYDPTGFLGHYKGLVTYWGWGNDAMRDRLRRYLQTQEEHLYAYAEQTLGVKPLSADEALRLAAATRSPGAMGYIDAPSFRWSQDVANHGPVMDAAQLDALKERAQKWYGFLMTLNARRYTGYQAALRDLDPSLAHSTSNTVNHCKPRDGGYHAASYQPLDFRFVAVWDDQGGAPEHIYETALAGTLLGANRDPKQPLWVDTSFGYQNGNIFRNALLLAGRGAQGTGYAMEMGGNLGANQATVRDNGDMNREIDAVGRLFERFGGLFTRATPAPRCALLYSKRQCVITPYAQSYVDGMVKMLYLLSHVGLPPYLLTEETLATGVPAGTEVVVVLGQTETLPADADAKLRAFAAAGGRVVTDTATTVAWPFAEKSAVLDVPNLDLGHPYNAMTAFNRQDATITDMRALAAERCPRLRALLLGAIETLPFDTTHPDVAICTLQGGAASFAIVANDSSVDMAALFTRDEQRTPAYQAAMVGHGVGAIASWMPLTTDLVVRGANPAVYDLFRGTRVAVTRKGGAQQVACDMTMTPGRILAAYPRPLGAGVLTATQQVAAGEHIEVRYAAADANGKALAAVVPVELTLTAPDGVVRGRFYRATDAQGVLTDTLPTGALDTPGGYTLTARQLCDGQAVVLPITLRAAAPLAAATLAGASVRDPQGIRRFLAGAPALVIPVFDAALAAPAQRLADGLKKQGVNARVWDNPPMVDYEQGYAVDDPAQQKQNDAVTRGEAIGKVKFVNMQQHVNGNFYGSAMTGFRYGKGVLLLGMPGKNPVLDGVAASGLLWSDTTTTAPGGALVQRLPWALGLRADTLVVAGGDLDGVNAGIDALLRLPARDAVTDGVRAARRHMFAQRGLPLTMVTLLFGKLTAAGAKTLPAQPVLRDEFSLVTVHAVQPLGDTLVVSLGRYGDTTAVVEKTGKVTWLPAVSTSGTTKVTPGQIITAMPRYVCGWRPDGTLSWRALADFQQTAGEAAVVKTEAGLRAIAPDGTERAFLPIDDARKPLPVPFEAKVVTARNGHEESVKEIVVTDAKAGKTISGFHLTARKANWSAPFTIEQQLLMTDGVLVAFQRTVGGTGVQWYARAAGTVKTLPLETAYLCDAALSTDGKLLAACGMEGEVVVTATAGERIVRTLTGPYPRLFPLPDGGFAVGTAEGKVVILDNTGVKARTIDLSGGRFAPDADYAVLRTGPLLSWATPAALDGPLPLKNFYWYLRDVDGSLKMVNWSPTAVLDFRWMDAVQGQVRIPAAKHATVTIRAAAKYFDEHPITQSGWASIVALRDALVKNERPAPLFRLYLDGKPIGTATPVGGTLVKFTTVDPKEGWAILKPKDDEFTTFTGEIDLPAGDHLLGIEQVGMQDCYATTVTIR
jgi:hypothetical protein